MPSWAATAPAAHTPDIVRGHQPARRDDRHVDRRHRGQQFVQRLGRRPGRRVERAAVPAGRRALRREHIDAAVDRRLRLGQRRHRADHRDARLAQPLHSFALGTPKVNDATSGRRSSSTSIFAAQWSSSNRGAPSGAP